MLCLLDVTINLQNFGTIIGVFLTSENIPAIDQRYWSFFNHGATRGELEWWSEKTALFWVNSSKQATAEQKFKKALTNAALFEILNTQQTKGNNPWPIACRVAEERYAAIDWVTWFVAGAQNLDIYSLAETLGAESGTGNFDDDVLASALSVGKHALGLSRYIDDPEELDDERPEDSSGEDVQLETVDALDS